MSQIAVQLKDVKVVNDTFTMENVNLSVKKGFITAMTDRCNEGRPVSKKDVYRKNLVQRAKGIALLKK